MHLKAGLQNQQLKKRNCLGGYIHKLQLTLTLNLLVCIRRNGPCFRLACIARMPTRGIHGDASRNVECFSKSRREVWGAAKAFKKILVGLQACRGREVLGSQAYDELTKEPRVPLTRIDALDIHMVLCVRAIVLGTPRFILHFPFAFSELFRCDCGRFHRIGRSSFGSF